MTQPVKSDNHFVPQFYLRNWTGKNGKLAVYRLLVSHERVPVWKSSSVRGVLFHRHLYSRVTGGHVSDAFEKWLDEEFERPAEPIISRLIAGQMPTRREWITLARFAAAQDVRTPARFVEFRDRWLKELEPLMSSVMESSLSQWEVEGANPTRDHRKREGLGDLPFRADIEQDSSGQFYIKGEITVGRQLWLSSMRMLLSNTIRTLHGHWWTVLLAPDGMHWPTSDDPVAKLNYYQRDQYDFKGGWGSRGSEILFPLTPKHLLYTKIGSQPRYRGAIPYAVAIELRRMLIARAHRYIIAVEKDDNIARMRPRNVDEAAYKAEQAAWQQYALQQAAAEAELESRPRTKLGPDGKLTSG